jgi:conjugative relaxase-like TrwC/TraI family protein
VLTVAKVTGGRAVDYAEYLEAKSEPDQVGDYYLKGGDRVQAPGRWADGATVVGCAPAAPVDGQVLRTLMDVRRPDNGQPLRRAGSTGTVVAAIDATFSVPKSVSAVWALAPPALRERIEQAHEQAIDRALRYSLRYVQMVRERIDQRTVIHAKARRLIATSWRHTTARAVGGQPPDPQLHSHVLLHGALRGDGMVMAIDSRSWLVHRRELGAAYRSELARGLAGLGFGIARGTGRAGRYFEVIGVPPTLIDRWSSRHHQVRKAIQARLADQRVGLEAVIAGRAPNSDQAQRELAELETAVQLAPKLDRFLTTATRAAKHGVRTHGELDRYWQTIARQHRFDAGAVGRLRTAPRTMRPAQTGQLLERMTDFDATFAEREARAVALEASAGAPIEDALAQLEQLRLGDQLLDLEDGSRTTRNHRAAEHQTVATAGRLAASRVEELGAELVDREVSRLDTLLQATGGGLSPEQRDAIELACSDRQLVVIEGQAGTGKSTTLTAVARAHQAAGRELIVTSTGGLAAERLALELDAAGASARGYSLAAFQTALDTDALELIEASTIIHDEAALASTREQQQLLTAVEESGARLIEVGDPRQSQPVGAGGLWQRLEQAAEHDQARVELTHNVRAHDPHDRHDQHAFRTREAETALRGYAERGRVHIIEEPRRAEDAALDAAHADRQADKRTIILSQTTNEHLDELNARAQAIRHQAGELGRHGAELPGRPYRLYQGDEIQIRRTIREPELGALRNGTTGVVADVGPRGEQLRLRLTDGRDVELERWQIDRADIRLAYVQHPFPSQGQTTNTAHLIVAEHATREGSYVGLTRARERTDIYAAIDELELEDDRDGLAALAEVMSRSEPETASIDTPLAHETEIEHEQALELGEPQPENVNKLEPDHDLGFEL